jgi:hypothetical protein
MNSFWQWVIHALASMGGVAISFTWIPAPYDIWVAAIWAGLVASAAFLNQSSVSTPTPEVPAVPARAAAPKKWYNYL